MKEKDWFSRGVALSAPCNQHIVDNSLQKLEELRQTGTRHQLIAVACSINHAKDICAMYRERGYATEIIHSNQTDEEKAEVMNQLKNGTLDCIVQVQMLGEGFDHPKLSVAAIFRPFRTLAPYVQFVGRIMRVVVQNDPAHPDNMGHIVTHLGMNLDERLKEFKQFESDDEAFWDKVVGGEEPELPTEVRDGSTRKKLGESDVVVDSEIVDSIWEEDFTTVEERHVIEDLQAKLKSLGLDPALAAQMVKDSQKSGMSQSTPAQPFTKQPLLEWEEAKKRLNDQVKRTANVLLNNVGLKQEGREMSFKYKKLGVSGANNYIVALTLVNHEVSKALGKERQQCSSEEFKAVIGQLEVILQKLVKQIKKIQSDYEKNTKG
jgi:superfamily II DNA/RNA helicase